MLMRVPDQPQAELSRARASSEAAAADVAALRDEAVALRRALGGMEARLGEYQAKDAEVGVGCAGGVGVFGCVR
jgi:hypothetical protein